MTKLPTIYKRTKKGQIQQWQIVVDGNSFYTIEGIHGGKLTQNKPTICKGKNIGRANETTPEEQALKEAQAKHDRKTEKQYTVNIDEVDQVDMFFECMLANKYLSRKNKIQFPVLVSSKIDGLRMVCTKDRLHTRNGKTFKSCPHIHKILKPIFDKHPNWVIDGEIYSSEVPFEKIVSLTRKKKPTQSDINESAKFCQIWIFDGVIDNKKQSFTSRFNIIQNEIKNLIGKNKSIKFVKNYTVTSHKEIEDYHTKFVNEGFEGLMIRDASSPYENKRSNYLLKYKHFFDDEYTIVDIVEGHGNRAGMAGNVVIKMKDGRTFSAGIKGGNTFYKELLIDKNKYIGKLATVRYQELTNDNIPRFPVAVSFDPIDR